MPTGLYTRWNLNSETNRFTPRQNKTRSFENMVTSYFQRTRPDCKSRAPTLQADRGKLTTSVLMDFVLIVTLCLTPWDIFTTFAPVKECIHPSLKKVCNVVIKRELDESRRSYIQEEGFIVIEIRECEWWRLYKTSNAVRKHIRENFPNKRSFAAEQLLEEIKKNGNSFGYVQCDNEVPENVRTNFVNFPPVFKNTLVSMKCFGDLMETCAQEEGIMSQIRKGLISNFTIQNGTFVTLLFFCSACNWD